MTIDKSGNVGIGTASPATTLDVNGTITATLYNGAIKDQGAGALSLKTKVFQLGDWNMDSTASIDVTLDTGANTMSKYLMINAMIRNDGDTQTNKLDVYPNSATPTMAGGSGILIMYTGGNTIARLYRGDSSVYDGTNYDSTSYNRGTLTVVYSV
jgi:hypothetical protein